MPKATANDAVYHQFKQRRPSSAIRRPETETLSNRRTRIRRRAGILFYAPENDPASLVQSPDAELVEEYRRRGAQVGAMAVAVARGVNRK